MNILLRLAIMLCFAVFCHAHTVNERVPPGSEHHINDINDLEGMSEGFSEEDVALHNELVDIIIYVCGEQTYLRLRIQKALSTNLPKTCLDAIAKLQTIRVTPIYTLEVAVHSDFTTWAEFYEMLYSLNLVYLTNLRLINVSVQVWLSYLAYLESVPIHMSLSPSNIVLVGGKSSVSSVLRLLDRSRFVNRMFLGSNSLSSEPEHVSLEIMTTLQTILLDGIDLSNRTVYDKAHKIVMSAERLFSLTLSRTQINYFDAEDLFLDVLFRDLYTSIQFFEPGFTQDQLKSLKATIQECKDNQGFKN